MCSIYGVNLEVEGMRYIEMHRGPAAYVHVLDPPPSRGGYLELEGRVNACHGEYVYESRHSHMPRLPRARHRVMAS